MDRRGPAGMGGTRLPHRFSADFYRAVVVVLLFAAALAGLIIYLRLTAPPEEDTYIPQPEVITPEVQLLQHYVRIDTSNPPKAELPAARFLLAQLQSAGIEGEIIESAPGRANVYARLRGRRPDEGLLLLHHMDVIPANPREWSHPPFAAEISLNQLWGRGALDAKGLGICHLQAFIAAAKAGRQPERDLVFLATADEEGGGELGVAWLLTHRPDIFQGIRYALNEGGIPEMRAEQLTYFGVEIGSKQFVKLRLHSVSRDTLQKARIALEPYIYPLDPHRILPEVRHYFRVIAPFRVQAQSVLEDIDQAVAEGEFWRLQDSFRSLTQNTVVPLGVEKEPAGFGLDVFLHNLPDEPPQRRIEFVRGVVEPLGARVEVLELMGPTRMSSAETPMFELIEQAVHRIYGPHTPVGPLVLAFATNDSRYLRSHGISSYGVSPFLADFHQTQGIHGVDERVRLDWLSQGARLIEAIVQAYCFPAQPVV